MRWTVFNRSGGGTAVGVIEGDAVVDLSGAGALFQGDLLPVIEAGQAAADAASAAMAGAPRIPLADVSFALPLAAPTKIVCLGLNYVDHAKEGGYDVPDYPALFMRTAASVVPHGAPLIRPLCSERFDYEAEFMAVIGKGGRHIRQADALDHVFGYTLFNDGSVRDYQRKTAQWTPGKNFDRSGSIGPDVVTVDELPAGCTGLRIQSRINGEVLQDANTDDMVFSVARTIEAISEFAALEPGDLIAMGTPPGVGHARTPPKWMKAGDTVEIEVERLGILSNPIADETR
ncbi:fumarylacetoacetate hydrolase family protein [Amorphus coralli]|uniref:fumarylacetoacetate hydrolase family protein n=1 Tax=Amorphus coralli TaxID=340680 RepID=UPI000376D6E3|nr:fumarylacetoacetate hydrolase family protein [Amorphus coralli]